MYSVLPKIKNFIKTSFKKPVVASPYGKKLITIRTEDILFLIVVSLFFASPLDTYIDFPIRAVVLWLVGIASAAILVIHKKPVISRVVLVFSVVLVPLVGSCILSGQFLHTFLGRSNFWIGAASAMSAIIFGIMIAPLLSEWHARAIYYAGLALALGSLLVSYNQIFAGLRLSGIPGNPVLLAIVLGVSLIVKWFLSSQKKLNYKEFIGIGLIVTALFLTMSRAAILPLLISGLTYYLYKLQLFKKPFKVKELTTFLVSVFLLLFFVFCAFPRIVNPESYRNAFVYRYHLVTHSFKLHTFMAPWGFGNGGITQSFNKYVPLPSDLQHTYSNDHAVIESSHNIFVDYYLQYGYIAATAFAVVLCYGMFCAIRLWKIKKNRLVIVIFFYIILQQQFTIAWLETEILLWSSLAGIIYLYHSVYLYKFRVYKKTQIALLCAVVLAVLCAISAVQIMADTKNARKRVMADFIFPLEHKKTAISTGSVYLQRSGVWNNAAQVSQHELYPAADLFAPAGTAILAAKEGTVIAVRDSGCNGYNQFPNIYVRGNDGFVYYYAHLMANSLTVTVNDYVQAGQVIAQVGPAQCASNSPPHLHFDISRSYAIRSQSDVFLKTFNYVDPQPVLKNSYDIGK